MLEVVGAELAQDDAGDGSFDGAGFWSVSDVIALAGAPSVFCATPVAGSGVADGSADVDETVVNDGEFEPDGDVDDTDDELDGGLDGLFSSVDEEADEVDEPEVAELDDELESDGSASATPGMVATAEPTPSAIANAPTRPTQLT